MGDGTADDEFEAAVRRILEQADRTDAPYEPSAAERARAARQSDLLRRLAEQEEHERRLAERDRKLERRRSRGVRRARWLAPLIVLGVVGAAIWSSTDHGARTIATPPELARPSNWPPTSDEVADAPLGTPPPLPAFDGPYEFAATQDDGSPVTWDPCRPIHYVVNPTGQPPGAEGLVEEAIARTSAATGLQFVADGTTDETWSTERPAYQPERYGERWAPVLIMWSTPAQVPDLAGVVAGQGGPTAVGFEGEDLVHVSGSVVLDAEQLAQLLQAPGGREHVRAVIQHELGHVVGLDHVNDPAQLMHPESSAGPTDWGPGDLRGLQILGTGECRPDI